jgi:hypothetical protein
MRARHGRGHAVDVLGQDAAAIAALAGIGGPQNCWPMTISTMKSPNAKSGSKGMDRGQWFRLSPKAQAA